MDGRDVQKDAKNNALHVLDYECDAAQVRVRVRVRLGASSTGRGYFLPYLPTDLLTYLRRDLPTYGRTYLPTYGLPTDSPTYLPTYVLTVQTHQCARLLARLKLAESNLCVVVNPKQNASGTGGLKGTQVR